MTSAVLLILLALWLAVLAPPVVRFVAGERHRADSVDHFNEALTVLGRTNGRGNGSGGVGALPMMSPAQRRRRDVLVGLLGATAGSLVLALAFGGPLVWAIHLVVDLLLVGYVALLVQFRRRTAERRTKVRYLPARGARRDDLAIARAVSGR